MAATDPQGQMQFWGEGFPYNGIKNANDGGQMQFWGEGFPFNFIFPPTADTVYIPKFWFY